MREERGFCPLASGEATAVVKLLDKLDRLTIELLKGDVEIKVRMDAIERHLHRMNGHLDQTEDQVGELKGKVSNIKTVGATLAAVWAVAMALFELFMGRR